MTGILPSHRHCRVALEPLGKTFSVPGSHGGASGRTQVGLTLAGPAFIEGGQRPRIVRGSFEGYRVTTTADTIRDFIRREAKVAASDTLFTDAVDLLDYGYIDSFGIVGLIELISARYRVDLSDIDFYQKGHRTIGGIAAIVDARVQAKG